MSRSTELRHMSPSLARPYMSVCDMEGMFETLPIRHEGSSSNSQGYLSWLLVPPIMPTDNTNYIQLAKILQIPGTIHFFGQRFRKKNTFVIYLVLVLLQCLNNKIFLNFFCVLNLIISKTTYHSKLNFGFTDLDFPKTKMRNYQNNENNKITTKATNQKLWFLVRVLVVVFMYSTPHSACDQPEYLELLCSYQIYFIFPG